MVDGLFHFTLIFILLWPLVVYFFLSWHKVFKILKNLFIIEHWILVINILIVLTLALIHGGRQMFALFFHAIELLGIINDFVIV